MNMNKKRNPTERLDTNTNKIRNLAGGVAFAVPEKLELYKMTMAWLVNEPRFYGDNATHNARVDELVAKISETDPEFVLKLATYGRNTMYLRSAPLYLMVAALKSPTARRAVRKYVPHIVKRADEIPNSIAIYKGLNNKVGSLPNQFKKGLQDTYHNFGAYHFGKYRMNDKDISQVDAIRLIHPAPKKEGESVLFKQIRHNSVPTPETWETIISVKGSNTETWTEASKVMGYMAKIRNLRNFVQHGVDLDPILAYLTDPQKVARSRQFPFRFYSAYKAMKNVRFDNPLVRNKIMNALETALKLSVANLPKLHGDTALFNDVSNSMKQYEVSTNSTMKCSEIGGLMSAMAYGFSDNALVGKFGTYLGIMGLNPNDSILTNAEKMISNDDLGLSTNGHLGFDYLTEKKIKVDRVMFFTDEQMWNTGHGESYLAKSLRRYKRLVNPNVYTYIFDLHGYGESLLPADEPNTMQISGFSDKIFQYVSLYERGYGSVLDEIDNLRVAY